ncbi:helicase-related protein [Shewanella xiamenensis]|uniref:helicase-related protein n=1 Tax=Shewanella xiamenensis TaxID=332186 RepID=UPI001C4E3FAC|nr:helicase-related protein [Shewanella xiamenensis]MBW0281491.1 helicase [Shewanella xiamenensis]MCT8872136.1 DEAD/DEAH box helicase family protein [Shewanella xiamenensis]UWH40044.1 DEAD/DEAH box helicase family protein [Shewanella xiamenensis]
MELIDNINRLLGDDLRLTLKPGARLKIAASCFSMYAFEALKAELEKIDELQFIFTSPTFTANEVTDKIRKERREFHIPKADRERSLYGSEFEIQLRNKLTQRAIAKECADWMRRKASFRSNRSKAPMQQFASVQTSDELTAYMPLHGFTAVDLGYQPGNAVSNFVNKMDEPAFTATYVNLFNQIWQDPEKLEDVTAQICEHIESVYQENSPESIYFLMLYNIFSEFLDDINEDVLPNDRTGYQETLIWNKLFNYQKDAATGIINKLETYSGCILADSVGLGKTFTALAVVKYYELRNKSVLVLCPKKLADNWLNYNRNLKTNIFARDRFNYDVLCHTDLSRTSGESFGTPLNRINWGNYDLVVIDESHNFRNNDAYKDKETRYQKLMNKVIREGVKTKVLMLSATPVNNRFNDLRNQLALAYEGESENLTKKLRTEKTVEEIFRGAQASFNAWVKLPAEERTARAILGSLDFDFFELLDSVTIARSRKHIQTFYDTKDIGQFPERRKPLSFHSPLTNRTDVMSFNEIFGQLSQLKLAVYAPISYVLPSRLRKYEEMYDTQVSGGKGKLRQADREKSLQALMTTNLLKRLESSIESFRLTLKSLRSNHVNILDKISAYNQSSEASGTGYSVGDLTDQLENLDADDDDLPLTGDTEIGGKIKISLADMDLPSWEHELKVDLEIIDALLTSMYKITPIDDAKLQHLKTLVLSKINTPLNPGNKKILIFTAFADTADYLYANLAPELLANQGLHSAKVTGKGAPQSTLKNSQLKKSYDFQELLTLFSPRSKEKAVVLPNEPAEIDLLIGTDCISEGQNLQDCDYLINYDIHWNPVRIIQRFGRVDRIGSLNTSIQLVNYWPDITLDEYINLKERVESRMMIADVTATGDDNVLSAQANDVTYRKEQLRRLQEEVIELEDLKTGVSITDLGLNDFRMDLLNYVKAHGEPKHIPNGMHAVVSANPALGLEPGVIFTLRNRNPDVNVNQHNRLHPYYLVYIARDGKIISDHTQVKRLLDLIRSGCKGQVAPISVACQFFNKQTNDGRDMQPYSELLGMAIRSMIEVKAEKDLDSLFNVGKTTALTNTIAGLDDFELITFLVIQETE